MDECPLCLEELDATDKATLYCQCEYQICAFCWQQLHDNASKDNTIAKCPNCRTPYDKDNIRMLEIDQEECVGWGQGTAQGGGCCMHTPHVSTGWSA